MTRVAFPLVSSYSDYIAHRFHRQIPPFLYGVYPNMGKSHVEPKPQAVSQRRLNIIYFVDSAKTRSVSIPIGRLNILIAFIFIIFSWSFISLFVIAWLGVEQRELSTRLKASLATIFEYQSRFDNVYELAYPPAMHLPDAGFDPALTGLRAEEYAEQPSGETMASSGSQRPSAPASVESPAAPVIDPKVEQKRLTVDAVVAKPEPKADPGPVASASSQQGASGSESFVSVGNTALERSPHGISLNFELTNRSTKTRTEGYIWAIAEFSGDDGQRQFVGAPRELKLSANGEPINPEKATYFGIKRFKKQSFQFSLMKGRPGVITSVRIGVMDLSGERRKTHRLSTELRVR